LTLSNVSNKAKLYVILKQHEFGLNQGVKMGIRTDKLFHNAE